MYFEKNKNADILSYSTLTTLVKRRIFDTYHLRNTSLIKQICIIASSQISASFAGKVDQESDCIIRDGTALND